MSRREFLRLAGATGLIAAAGARPGWSKPDAEIPAKEARFWEPLGEGHVRCTLCPWGCVVPPGGRGRCRVRENRGGRYYSLVHGRPCALNNDPIEKKPFFHVYPGSRSFSIATVGCNIECKFCQNWDISQASPDEVQPPYRSPEEIAALAAAQKCKTVAYTYSEPVIFSEYMLDCARAAKARGLGNVVVSNGFIGAEPLKEVCAAMTAIKIDFKAFTNDFYEQVCAGRLEPVRDTLKRLADANIWFEIVVLLIPTLNDNPEDLKRMAAWIAKELRPSVPLHFTRFHPAYKLRNLPPTPPATLSRARAIALAEGCQYVYTGNLPGGEGENTYCPQCKTAVVERYGYTVPTVRLIDGKCPKCSNPIPGLWA